MSWHLPCDSKGDARPAVEELEAAIRLKPTWAEAHYALGATWYDLRDLPDSAKGTA